MDHGDFNNFGVKSVLLRKEIADNASKFVAKLYNFVEIPRKTVEQIKSETSEFIRDIIQSLERKVVEHIEQSLDNVNDLRVLRDIIQSFSNPFVSLQSEWQVHAKTFCFEIQ